MEMLIVIVVLLFVTVVLVSVGEKVNLPWPVLITLVTAVVIVIPQMPRISIDPDIILPIFLPPLLWAIGQRVTWGMLKRSWRSVLVFSLALTAVSALTVGAATWMIVPGMSVGVALAIGAAVAPPDPVAVEAVSGPVGIPRRIVSHLQTEGIFNDAVSLVLFHAAVLAIHSGTSPNPTAMLGEFVYSACVAVVLGLIVGWAGAMLRRNLVDSIGRSALTLVIPFVVYLVAEELNASGVVAVVIAAIHMSSNAADLTAEERLTNKALWSVLEVLVTGLAFGLIGLEAGELLYGADSNVAVMIGHGVLISLVAVGVRLAWFTAIWWWGKYKSTRWHTPRTFAEALVMTWAGMRGLVTLALVLALPEMAGDLRTEAVFIALTVLFFTMVFPGITLPFLVRRLGISATAQADDSEEQELLEIARKAMWRSMYNSIVDSGNVAAFDRLRQMSLALMDKFDDEQLAVDANERIAAAKRQREVVLLARQQAALAAQAAVLEVRNRYDYEVVSEVLYQIDVQVRAQGVMASDNPLKLVVPKPDLGRDKAPNVEAVEEFFELAEKRVLAAQKNVEQESKKALEEEAGDS